MAHPSISKHLHQSKMIYQFVKNVFPLVDQHLDYWRTYVSNAPDPILSEQALSSIEKKSFHAQGGSIYGLYTQPTNPELIQFIVALQTISDYLDNLCDRVGLDSQQSFLQLHQAITDALDPSDTFSDYYAYYPYRQDGDYLKNLVLTCKSYIRKLPSYFAVQGKVLFLGQLYSEMQSLKHISLSKRELAMHLWARPYLSHYSSISTWEFSAAAGSTLGIFMLCALAENTALSQHEVESVLDTYFPWICGLHILLDYFIDQREDLATGDLNFVAYYKNEQEKNERLGWFLQQSMEKISYLKNPTFHMTVLEGLLAMYFSDPKTSFGEEYRIHKQILKAAPVSTSVLYHICKLLRKRSMI